MYLKNDVVIVDFPVRILQRHLKFVDDPVYNFCHATDPRALALRVPPQPTNLDLGTTTLLTVATYGPKRRSRTKSAQRCGCGLAVHLLGQRAGEHHAPLDSASRIL